MRGDISTGKASNRHPLDWYVEQGWEWDQIARQIGMQPEHEAGAVIWDPCCGYGHAGSSLESYGFQGRIVLSDVVDNVATDDFEIAPLFFVADFLEEVAPPASPCSIFFNPPYSYRKGILEAMVRHALTLATHRVCALVPGKWLAPGIKRSRLFRVDYPPQIVMHFSQRPSMPPGDRILQMGNRAYRGGVIDYAAVLWDVRAPTLPGETRTIWLPPLGQVG